MTAYYNDLDPFCVDWLRNCMENGLIPGGTVDWRDIRNVRREDVSGYTQAHFFAGVGGWPIALRMAGWPDDVPVWTGSCPCQPFSTAGSKKGFNDARHLWPKWFRLIEESRPPVILGEQVARAAGVRWLDVVLADLEAVGYAVGSAELCAAGVAAPHIRPRLWFVAVSPEEVGWLVDALGGGRADEPGELEDEDAERTAEDAGGPGRVVRPWEKARWIECADWCHRPVEPGVCPLVDGLPGPPPEIGAYGNAIVPQVAAAFVGAVIGALRDMERSGR